MKKIYSLITFMAALVLSMPSKAGIQSATELFGTWTFTADIQYNDDSYKDKILSGSEVTIMKDASGYFDAEIDGLCGVSGSYQLITLRDYENAKAIKVTNPNGGNWDAWGSLGLYMAETDGRNPADFTNGYGNLYYTINDDVTVITLPDFSFVKISDWNAPSCDIVAVVTNAKLTLKERQQIEVADISGLYEFNVNDSYDYGVIGNWPTSFNMNIVSKSDDNKSYDVTWGFEQFDAITFNGAFDGNILTLDYSNQVVAYDSIYLAPSYGYDLTGTIDFNLLGENLSMSKGCSFAVPFYNESGEVDSLSYIYWYGGGIAKKHSDEPVPTFTFDGKYNATAVISTDLTEGKLPVSGPVEIEFYEGDGNYYVTKFLGYDTYTMNYGGMLLMKDETDPMKASIDVSAYYNYLGYIGETWESGFYVLLDDNMANNPIPVTFSEDGTMTIGQFTVGTEVKGETGLAALYESLTAKKDVPSAQDWAGSFKLNDIDFAYMINNPGIEFGDSITISYDEKYDTYVVMSFMGNETYYMNYGGMTITPDENDPHKATMTYGTLNFDLDTYDEISLYSADMTKEPVELTLNEDGTVTVGDFSIARGPYMMTPVKLVANTSFKEAQKILWNGDLKLNPVEFKYIAEGAAVPTCDTLSISYDDKYDCFIVMSFMGYETYYMNYGAMEIQPDANDVMKATISYGILDYDIDTNEETSLYSTDLSKTPVELTMEEDGTVTVGGMAIAKGPYFGTPTKVLLSTDVNSNVETRTIEAGGRMYNLNGIETDKAEGIVIMKVGGKSVKVLMDK